MGNAGTPVTANHRDRPMGSSDLLMRCCASGPLKGAEVTSFSPKNSTEDGTSVLHRFITRGRLDSPWAVTLAPSTFGFFGGDILVGNFGDGHINVFDHSTGQFLGRLTRGDGDSIVIPDLWGMRFGNGALGASTNALFFTAGINHEADGLFGQIVPVS
jgi:uncharacterized protein (TIGR03118 family)